MVDDPFSFCYGLMRSILDLPNYSIFHGTFVRLEAYLVCDYRSFQRAKVRVQLAWSLH